MDCTQCGHECYTFCEGVCVDCYESNQRELDEHNARFNWWEGLSDSEREKQIRNVCK